MGVSISDIDSRRVQVVLQRQPQAAAFEILAQAREAAEGLGYAGNVTPEQAWLLFSNGIAELVDVRTASELRRVGQVPGGKHVEWLRNEDRQPNPRFLTELKSVAGKDDVVLLLCRSSKRSVAAALAAAAEGYRNVFNVLEGFEGDGRPQHGWLKRGLPAAQG